MAASGSEGLDPKTFKSWEDAFKYPIPTVRRFQQQLRGDITSNRERLRSLVGGSYRELLGTADAIIQMDSQMKEVEIRLGETSRRCNTDRMSRSIRNTSKLTNRVNALDKEIYSTMSQLAVLHACPDVLVKVLRNKGSVIQAAKILVIARRLYRALSELQHVSEYAESIWLRLSKLRQKLRDMIHRQLTSSKTSEAGLIDALCAYALATSSASASDLLRHFHRLRLDVLSSIPPKSLNHHQAALNNLRLWIRTLKDTRAIFQKPLGLALAKLKSGPIFKDPDVQGLDEFNLETHEAWLGNDIRNFTPYLRHDDLTVPEVARHLSIWAPDALKAMLAQLKQLLGSIEAIEDVVRLRNESLGLLFSHYHIAGVRKDVVLTGFREVFGGRLQQLVNKTCQALDAVATKAQTTLEQGFVQDNFDTPRSLWSDTLVYTDTVRNVGSFTKTVHDTLRGLTPTVQTITIRYESWLEDIEAIREVISAMKSTKWDEHLDELDSESESDSESPEENSTKRIQSLLKDTDPKLLEDALTRDLTTAFRKLAVSLARFTPDTDGPHSQAQAALLLRVTREIEIHLPPDVPSNAMALPNISQLYAILATPPAIAAVKQHEQFIVASLTRQSPPSRQLWDEQEPLPTLPSPWVFRLLQGLEATLAELGADLWAPDACSALKGAVADQIQPLLQGRIEIPSNKHTDENDANGASDPTHSLTADMAKQTLFDIEYLACLSPEGGKGAGAALRAPTLKQADVDEEQAENIAAAAREYRKRTALLFPLTN